MKKYEITEKLEKYQMAKSNKHIPLTYLTSHLVSLIEPPNIVKKFPRLFGLEEKQNSSKKQNP